MIEHEGTYYMFYCAGGDAATSFAIHLATSRDLWTWERHPANPMLLDGVDARDPYILRVGDEWAMYYTANSEPARSHHVVAYRTSSDLVNWGEKKIAFTDPLVGTIAGPTESPTVIRRGKYYYLFIGPRRGYAGTDVFQSEDPFHFELDDFVGHIKAHAAEVVRDRDGRWYVSHCGWGEGGVYLAPLFWNDGQETVVTNVP